MAAGPYADDEWIVGSMEDDDGAQTIVRFRSHLPGPDDRARWRHLIVVGWPYEPDDDSGMPDEETDEQQDAFEEAVHAGLEASGAGVQAASLTGDGLREWRYYATDPAAFMRALNEALRDHPAYPLELEAFEDEAWSGLSELLPPRN